MAHPVPSKLSRPAGVRSFRLWFVAAACATLVAANARAGRTQPPERQPANPPIIPSETGTFAARATPPSRSAEKVQLPETIKLSRLVDLTSEITGVGYSYLPAELEANVTLRLTGGLSADQIPALLSHVLASRGLTTVRLSGSPVLSVVKIEQASGLASLHGGDAGSYVTEVVTPKHLSPKAFVETMKLVMSRPGGNATVLGESNQVLLSDFGPRLMEIRELIQKLDTPDGVVMVDVPLRHATSGQVLSVVTQLTAKRESAGGRKLSGEVMESLDERSLLVVCPPDYVDRWRDVIAIADQRDTVHTRTYVPKYFASQDVASLIEAMLTGPGALPKDDRFQIVVDELTGTLMITGTQSQHDRIAELFGRLDSAERRPTPMRTFAIRNRSVSELLSMLQTLIAAGALERGGDAASAQVQRSSEREDVRRGASQSDPRPLYTSDSSVDKSRVESARASAGESTFSNTRRIAEDVRSSSASGSGGSGAAAVTSSAGTADTGGTTSPRTGTGRSTTPALSLTADESANMLIAIGEPRLLSQLEQLIVTLDVRQPQVMLEALLVSLSDSQALSLGVELEKLGGVDGTSIKLASLFGLSSGGPVSGTTSAATGFSGIVLNPGEFGIVVRALESSNLSRSLSNPKLLVSNNEQAVFSSVLQQPITQQTRTGSNDTTFSYGGSESAGTTISARPQIAQGDHLVLTYSIKLSNFVGTSNTAGLPPPKQENSIDSIATIPDGHTIVVGGIELTTDSDAESRVPGLGRIPLLGELFKQRNNGQGKTKFYVFLRPTILRNTSFEDLKHISTSMGRSTGIPDDDGLPPQPPRIIR